MTRKKQIYYRDFDGNLILTVAQNEKINDEIRKMFYQKTLDDFWPKIHDYIYI